MKGLLLLLVVASFIALSFAQANCRFGNCRDCTAEPGCGWCAATQRCLAGNANGPTGAEPCYISWEYGSCPQCAAYLDCRTCQAHDADCYWCATANAGNGGCLYYGQQLGCPVSHVCPCGDWSTCSDCNADSNCQWCDDSNGGGSCSASHIQCPAGTISTHTCPCSSNLDCPSCKQGANCAWCDTTGKCYTRGDLTACGFHQIGNVTCSSYCASAASECFGCNELQGCVWCSDTKTCTDEDTATCARQPQCAKCTKHRYCDPCLDEDGCKWCDGPGGAFCSDNCGSGFQSETCLGYCNALTVGGCSSCVSHTGCVWCGDTKSCVDADQAKGCLIAHQCDGKVAVSGGKCGFDGGAFVGGMFLIIGIAILGGGGYAFYKYKTGKGSTYNQL